jgi:hypothetical protein
LTRPAVATDTAGVSPIERLPAVRQALLQLHKTLLDSERISYEQTMGTIPSPGHFLKLVTTDPWFAWLHPLSHLIVTIDEALETDAPLSDETAGALLAQTAVLLVTSETGEGFAKHYDDAMQRDPDVVLAHCAVRKLLPARSA